MFLRLRQTGELLAIAFYKMGRGAPRRLLIFPFSELGSFGVRAMLSSASNFRGRILSRLRYMSRLRWGWEWFNEVLRWAAGIIILFMMLSVCFEVVMRYVFNAPTRWVVDVNSYALVFIIFLMASWLLLKNRHVKMEAVLTLLSPKRQSYVILGASVLALAFTIALTWISWDLAWKALRGGHYFVGGIEIPQFPIKVIIPIGAGLLSVQLLINIISRVTSLRGEWAQVLHRICRLVPWRP